MIAEAISAAGSVLGGILGNNATEKANKQNIAFSRELNQNKVQWLAEDAKKAGIHPLAALGSSASGSWATPTIAPSTSLGDSIGRGADAVARGIQAREQAVTSALQTKLLEAQISLTNAQAANAVSEATSRTKIAGMRANEKLKLGPLGEVTKHPAFSDAQDVEDRYGDIIEGVYGLGVGAGDLVKNARPYERLRNERLKRLRR